MATIVLGAMVAAAGVAGAKNTSVARPRFRGRWESLCCRQVLAQG
jgi:hypothetical protein